MALLRHESHVMRVGAHDTAAIRQGCIIALGDAMRLFGVGSRDSVPAIQQLCRGLAATAPLMSDAALAVTVTVPVSHECVTPIACGSYSVEGEYESHIFEVTGGIYHVGDSHRYAFACSRNRRSSTYVRGSRSLFGAVYLHRNGKRTKLFIFDEQGNLTAPGRAK